MADSPGSPLSSHASSEFTEDVKLEDLEAGMDLPDHPDARMPPSKRQKLGAGAYRATPLYETNIADGDISSDSEGSVPSSPIVGSAALVDDEHLEQVTVCRWRNCPAGDLGNMDALVNHIHEEHIGQKQKKWACEWESCSRLDYPHASGYALRAHMRSHTREKPFYCALPECDRSFTRSDALAKHMRTVHETEALRPSDPIPRNHSQAQIKPQRLKLIVNARPQNGTRDGQENDYGAAPSVGGSSTLYASADGEQAGIPTDILTKEDLALPSDQLFRLLRRQLHWGKSEGEQLRTQTQGLESVHKAEWQDGMLALANLMEAELATAYTLKMGEDDYTRIMRLRDEMLPQTMLPMPSTPWYRIVPKRAPDE